MEELMNIYMHSLLVHTHTILMGCLHIVTQELHQHRIYSQNNDSVPCPVLSHVVATVWTWTQKNPQ